MKRKKDAFCDLNADGTYPLYRYPFMFYERSSWHPVARASCPS